MAGLESIRTRPQFVSIRPLNKGMITSIPSQLIADGGFCSISGYIAALEGLKRRAGFSAFGTASIPYPIVDYITIWKADGSQVSVIATEESLWKFNPITGATELPWAYNTGSISVAGAIVTGTGTAWDSPNNWVKAGDLLRVGSLECRILSVDSATQITLVNSTTIANGSYASYSIQRSFYGGRSPLLDLVIFNSKLLIADGKHPILCYDPSTDAITLWSDASVYTTGSISVSGAIVTGTGTLWSTAGTIYPGFILEVGTQKGVVKTIDSNTKITLESATITNGSYSAYTLRKANDPDTGRFIPACVAAHDDRIWAGWTYDAVDLNQRQRARWSDISDPQDFSTDTNYMDLPYVNGAMRRILPLGDNLVIYFDDAVFVGERTSYVLAPFRFSKVETGGVGLAGPKAVVPFSGGHYFVGQDDIYFLDGEGAHRIGSPIVKDTIRACKHPEHIYAIADPENFCIVFGFPGDNEYISKLWYFDYRASAWSFSPVECNMIANPVVNVSNSWDSLTGTWDSWPTESWDSILSESPGKRIYLDHNGSMYIQSESGYVDFTTSPIDVVIETKDHDFSTPDLLKAFVLLGLKIEYNYPLQTNVIFNVEISVNHGRTWKQAGQLVIPQGSDEGFVATRIVGSTIRARLRSTSAVSPYTITEYSWRLRTLGDEADASTQV